MTVKYADLATELMRLNDSIAHGIASDFNCSQDWWRYGCITIGIVGGTYGGKVRARVNFNGVKCIEPNSAAIYAKWIAEASEMARNFKYHGYNVDYT